MKIVVLAGGLSQERDVSLTSGSLVANALIENGHDVLLLDVYEGIKDENIDINLLFRNKLSEKYSYKVNSEEPDLEEIRKRNNYQKEEVGKNVLETCKNADIVYIALHGGIGENGTIQALFDCMNIKYTGSGAKGSVLAMDKDLTKVILKNKNIPTANWTLLDLLKDSYEDKLKDIKLPVVVKPCSNGSSIGVSIVKTKEELKKAIDSAKKYEDKLLIEDYLEGREFSIGVINNEALPPIEIIPLAGFYDYKNKYQSGLTKEVCPAEITKEELDRINDLAIKVYQELHLDVYCRMDFILKDNTFYCLEANTLPGMTPTSLLPQEAKEVGIDYNNLCDKIIELSLKKYE